jgi:hypothetical protein
VAASLAGSGSNLADSGSIWLSRNSSVANTRVPLPSLPIAMRSPDKSVNFSAIMSFFIKIHRGS